MLQIMIIDDHKMFIEGIANILEEEHDMEVTVVCFKGEDSYQELKEKKIDFVLLDIQLNTMSGLDICKYIRKEYPAIKILMLSMFKEESFITEAMKHGAHGYILKSSGQDELLKAIRAIRDGLTYFSTEVTQVVMNSLRAGSRASKTNKTPKISKREQEVLQLIVEEHTTKEIAEKLFISLKTVESHRSNLLAKMEVRNIAGLVRKALEHKLVN